MKNSNIIWIDPVNRDAQFLSLVATISQITQHNITFYSTFREVFSTKNINIKPFFVNRINLISDESGRLSWRTRIEIIFNYLKSIDVILKEINKDCIVIYTGMFLPELEILGLKKIKQKNKNLNILIHNFGNIEIKQNFFSFSCRKFFLQEAQKYIFLSNFVKSYGIKKYGIPNNKVIASLHPNFNPMLNAFSEDSHFSESLCKFINGRPVISFISRLNASHGIDLYLQLINQLLEKSINICGVIIGRPSPEYKIEDYERLIKNNNNLNDKNIYLKLGKYSYEELLSVLSLSDCVLAPYRNISQSGAIALALGKGVPVIASDVGANNEMIKHRVNGLLFDVRDINLIVDKISSIYTQGTSMRQTFPLNEFFNSHLDPYQWLDSILNTLC